MIGKRRRKKKTKKEDSNSKDEAPAKINLDPDLTNIGIWLYAND